MGGGGGGGYLLPITGSRGNLHIQSVCGGFWMTECARFQGSESLSHLTCLGHT